MANDQAGTMAELNRLPHRRGPGRKPPAAGALRVRAHGGGGRARHVRTVLPPASRSVAEARTLVASALRSWDVPDRPAQDIVLAASELVTNAVEHGTGDIEIDLTVTAGQILLRVWDGRPDMPTRLPQRRLSTRNRGLAIVEAVSSSWGFQLTDCGKWVWAEFSLELLTQ